MRPAPVTLPRLLRGHGPSTTSTALDGTIGSLSAERICATILVLVILLCYGWNAPRIMAGTINLPGEAGAEAGDSLRQMAFLLLFALALCTRFMVSGGTITNLVPTLFAPMLAWCWLSLFWAISPEVAFRRIAFTTIVIITVACCLQILPYRRVIAALTIGFWIILLADWLAMLLFPYAVHMPGELDEALVGNWRGIHNDKNEAGAFCALATILFLHEAIRLRSWLSGGASVLLAVVFLYHSQSKTSAAMVLVALLVGLASQGGYRNPRLRRFGLLLLGGVALPAGIAVWEDAMQKFANFIADPSSLTGRVQIWPVLAEYVADHPLLGAGYGSFWGIGAESPVRDYTSGWITEIYSAHNGYLDLLVQTGFLGLALTVACLMLYPLALLFFARLPPGVSRSLLCAVLVFGWLRDILESSLLDRANSTWTIMVVAYCVLAKYASPFRTPTEIRMNELQAGPQGRAEFSA